MNRRDFLGVSAAAMSAGFLIDPRDVLAAPAAGGPGAPANPIDSPPVLQSPATDGMTVAIAVNTLSTVWIEFGTTEKLGDGADDARHGLLPLNGCLHRIRMEGLKPGTTYFYRVAVMPIEFTNAYKIKRGVAAFTEIYSFKTLGTSNAASFCVINDTHENVTTLGGVVDRIAAAKAELTFWNGDIFNDVRSDEQVVANVLRPAGKAYATRAPLCFASGNHDVRGIHARSLERFVDTPRNERFHVIRHGPIAFIVLDTGEDKPDGHEVYAGLNAFAAYREKQRVWLEKAVEQEEVKSAPLRVVIEHIPMWGPGASEDSRKQWAGTLAKAKVSAMICGHTHKFAFTPADGDHGYPQLVGGGPAPEIATVIEGRAEGAKLSLIVRDLTGKEIGNFEVRG